MLFSAQNIVQIRGRSSQLTCCFWAALPHVLFYQMKIGAVGEAAGMQAEVEAEVYSGAPQLRVEVMTDVLTHLLTQLSKLLTEHLQGRPPFSNIIASEMLFLLIWLPIGITCTAERFCMCIVHLRHCLEHDHWMRCMYFARSAITHLLFIPGCSTCVTLHHAVMHTSRRRHELNGRQGSLLGGCRLVSVWVQAAVWEAACSCCWSCSSWKLPCPSTPPSRLWMSC